MFLLKVFILFKMFIAISFANDFQSNAIDDKKCIVLQSLEEFSIEFKHCNVDYTLAGPKIEKITMKSSKIDLSKFNKSSDLKEMYIDECIFDNYNINLPPSLEKVLIINSPNTLELASKVFWPAKKLKHLELRNNSMYRLSSSLLDNNNNLEELDISQNKIRMIPMDGFFPTTLVTLIASHNRIQAITSSHLKMPNLKHIDISYNSIKILSSSAFDTLGNLETLKMSHNFIKSIQRDHFRHLFHLQHLDLSFNNECVFDNDSLDDFEDLKVLLI